MTRHPHDLQDEITAVTAELSHLVDRRDDAREHADRTANATVKLRHLDNYVQIQRRISSLAAHLDVLRRRQS